MSSASDFVIKDGVLKKYKGQGGDVVIPNEVTRIDNSVFAGCNSITSVFIPETVRRIGVYAFQKCANLTAVTIQKGVTNIGNSAFANCKKLTSIVLPEGLKAIEGGMFFYCVNLIDVTIPSSVSQIDGNAFYKCRSIKRIVIPDNVKRVGSAAFHGCACDIELRHWIDSMSEAIQESDSIRIHTEDVITDIPAKYRRLALMGFISEETIDWDSERAKSYLAYMKRNVGKICDLAFLHDELLQLMLEHRLIQAKNIDIYLEEAERRGDTDKKALLLNYQNELGMEKVTKARARKEKDKEDYADALAGRIGARDSSKGIEGITFVITGKLSKVWKSRKEVQSYLENYGAKLGISITKETDYLVANDTDSNTEKYQKAKEYNIPVISEAKFNEIVCRRFRCTEKVSIPPWLKTIPEGAFNQCHCLKSITIPEGITEIESNAFFECKSLEGILIPTGVSSIGDWAFSYCNALSSVAVPDGVVSIGSYAFYHCDKLVNIVLPASVKRIDYGAFAECPNLTIHAPAGSYAEKYAKENNIPFVAE